jgi:microcystin-dependent protein
MAKIINVHSGGIIGHTVALPVSSAPAYALLCDGSAVSRTTYAALFAAIGTAHGTGDGSTTFNLPDYRGRFLRGQNQTTGRDPDTGGRTAMNPGGNTADNVGSLQGHAFQTHNHTDSGHAHNRNPAGATEYYWPTSGPSSGALPAGGATNQQTALNTNTAAANIQNASASGTFAQASSNESRPVNAYTNYYIVWK